MNRIKWSIDHFIFEEYTASGSSLGIFRILFAAYMLLVLPLDLWISSFPDSFFNPPLSLTALYFRGFPSAPFFVTLNALAIFASVCLLAGYRTRFASIALAVSLFVMSSWAYSFGKINHDLFVILIPLVMGFSGWGNAYSMDARRGDIQPSCSGWPLALLALITALGMMTSAEGKVVSGWLNPHSNAVMAHLLFNDIVVGRSTWFAGWMLRVRSGVFWKSLDYGTVLIEALFLLTVARRSAFRIVCAGACFFHLGIALSMKIVFVPNILMYAAFCDWSKLESRTVVRRLLKVWKRILEHASGWGLLLSSATLTLVFLGFGNPVQEFAEWLAPEWDSLGLLTCGLAAIVAFVFLAGVARRRLELPASGWFNAGGQTQSG